MLALRATAAAAPQPLRAARRAVLLALRTEFSVTTKAVLNKTPENASFSY
jgi:hypothetical protein